MLWAIYVESLFHQPMLEVWQTTVRNLEITRIKYWEDVKLISGSWEIVQSTGAYYLLYEKPWVWLQYPIVFWSSIGYDYYASTTIGLNSKCLDLIRFLPGSWKIAILNMSYAERITPISSYFHKWGLIL